MYTGFVIIIDVLVLAPKLHRLLSVSRPVSSLF